MAWELCAVLSAAQPAFVQPPCMHYLAASFLEQLLAEHHWEWSVFVMMFNPYESVRTKLVRDMIQSHIPCVLQNYTTLTEMKESQQLLSSVMKSPLVLFLVDELGVDPTLVYACLGDHAHSVGDVLLEVVCRLATREWDSGFVLLLKHILPAAVINNNTDLLVSCLSLVDGKEMKAWKAVYDVMESYVATIADTDNTVQYEDNDRLFEAIQNLQAIPSVVEKKTWLRMLEEMKWRVVAQTVQLLVNENEVDEEKVERCGIQVGSLRCKYVIQKQLLDSLQSVQTRSFSCY